MKYTYTVSYRDDFRDEENSDWSDYIYDIPNKKEVNKIIKNLLKDNKEIYDIQLSKYDEDGSLEDSWDIYLNKELRIKKKKELC